MLRIVALCAFLWSVPLVAAEPDPSKARIEGVVVDEGGKPVAGATVSMVRYGPRMPLATATTNADGTFRLISDTATVHHRILLASTDKGKHQGVWQVEGPALDLVTPARIVLKPARSIVVRVVNDLKDAVLGASVGLMGYSMPLLVEETDGQGIARFQFPADMRLDQVMALKSGVGAEYYVNGNAYSKSVTPPREITLTLDNARTLRVHAEDSSGAPLAGVEIVPSRLHRKGQTGECNLSGAALIRGVSATTNKDGLATFDWVPTDCGAITFYCHKPGFHQVGETVYIPIDPDRRLVCRLNRYQLTTLSGKVTLPDGRAGTGIFLEIAGQGPMFSDYRNYARTTSDGSWTASAYLNHTYIIAPITNDWAAKSRKDVFVKDGESLIGLDFRLEKGTAVYGRVTVGKNKNPLANQSITMLESPLLSRWTKTDSDGKYIIRVAAGSYTIGIAPNLNPIEVSNVPKIEKDFHLERPTIADLRGSVRRADGKTAADASLSGGTLVSGSVFPTAVTDKEGNFVFRRRTVKMLMYVVDAESTQASVAVVDEDTETVNLNLAPASMIVGQILDQNKLPMPGVHVNCVMTVGQGKDAKRIRLRTTPDALGVFRFAGLVDGSECQIVVVSGQQSQALKAVKVSADKTVALGQIEFDKK